MIVEFSCEGPEYLSDLKDMPKKILANDFTELYRNTFKIKSGQNNFLKNIEFL